MRRLAITLIGALLLGGALASPAHAADDLAAWKNGFPPASAIGASLGSYDTPPMVDAVKLADRWFVCAEVQAPATTGLASAEYATTPPTPSGVSAQARVYASAAKAKAAFTAITKRLSRCAGTGIQESEPGSKSRWRVTTSVGRVPAVTVDGTVSLSVYTRQTPVGTEKPALPIGSSLKVVTLSGDTILVSEAFVENRRTLSPAQRQAVASFATAFVDSWGKANG